MVFTRRAGPLAGAGVLALVLQVRICVSGAPLAVAVAGVFVQRVLAPLLPLPVSSPHCPPCEAWASAGSLMRRERSRLRTSPRCGRAAVNRRGTGRC